MDGRNDVESNSMHDRIRAKGRERVRECISFFNMYVLYVSASYDVRAHRGEEEM